MLSHRNVVQFYGIVSEPPNFCLITGLHDVAEEFCLILLINSVLDIITSIINFINASAITISFVTVGVTLSAV